MCCGARDSSDVLSSYPIVPISKLITLILLYTPILSTSLLSVKTREAWVIASALLSEEFTGVPGTQDQASQSMYHFWGAKMIYSKIQRDFNQLGEQEIQVNKSMSKSKSNWSSVSCFMWTGAFQTDSLVFFYHIP